MLNRVGINYVSWDTPEYDERCDEYTAVFNVGRRLTENLPRNQQIEIKMKLDEMIAIRAHGV